MNERANSLPGVDSPLPPLEPVPVKRHDDFYGMTGTKGGQIPVKPFTPPAKERIKASQILADMAVTFEEKAKEYADNHERLGGALAAFFPDGITLKNDFDFQRFMHFSLATVKMTRYAVNFAKGHQPSVHDLGVYSALLEALDANGPKAPF